MKSLRRIFSFMRPYGWVLFFGFWATALPVAMELSVPRLLQFMIDDGIRPGEWDIIVQGALWMFVAAMIGAASTLGQGYCRAVVSQGLAFDIRHALFRHIQSLSFANLDQMQTGRLMTRVSSDVDVVRMFSSAGLALLLRVILMIVGSMIMLLLTDWQLSLIMFAVTAISAVFIRYLMVQATRMFVVVQQRLGTLNTRVQENLAGIQVVKAFVRSGHEIDQFSTSNLDYREKNIEVGILMAVAMPVLQVLTNVGTVAVLWFGGMSVIGDRLTIGELIAFNNYLMTGMGPLLFLGNLLMMAARAEASAERVLDVLDTEPALKIAAQPHQAERISGRVVFDNVSFHYSRQDPSRTNGFAGVSGDDVLHGISFVAEPGQQIALLGATGSGKSTLVSLIARFYDVNGGAVTVDGVDVRDWQPDALRGQIGMVLQESILFSGSVRDNIAYGAPSATLDVVIGAAQAAQAHEFVMEMPHGYDSVIEAGGANLSGGQKQRIAIARALLIQPGILIFDDSTSAVDMETEYKIQAALEDRAATGARRNGSSTTFIIAQRITSVLHADQILVLDRGRIAERGTHMQLMESSHIYREIYDSQLGEIGGPHPPGLSPRRQGTGTMTNQGASASRPRFVGGHGGGRATGEKAKDRRGTLRRLSDYLKPYHARLLVVGVLVVVATMLGLAGPALLGRAIDQYVIHNDIDGLVGIALIMLAVYLAQGVFTTIHGVIMIRIGQYFVADIRAALFRHFQALSMDYHDRHRVGDLMSRISNDSETINQILSNGLIQFTTNILSLGGIMVAMLLLNLPLALGTLIILPIMLFITSQITERTRKAFRGMQKNLGILNAVMEENITGIRAVQAYAQEDAAIAQFQVASSDYRAVGIRADFITAALGPMFTTMMILTVAGTSLLGGWLALRDTVSVGVLATFVVYIMNFFRPMRGIAMVYNQLQSALAGAERIFAVLDATPTVTDEADATPLTDIRGEVTFEGVDFAYTPGVPVLEDISLQVQPGATIALVGPTGAGKTTIVSLLSRFYDVSGGSIRIDGRDIRAVTQDSIRAQLGIVLQDTFLFSGTVMENIRYGRLDASDEEVIEAAKLANADGFIHLLPRGYETQVSEKGHNFSQGQRQLLAIARAILADPRILILDEATSSVDTRTEIQIQEALLRLLEGRTAFVIAHRLSTIRNADQVLVIKGNRIIERGRHEELLALGGFYQQLYASQYQRLAAMAAGA